MLRIEPKAFRLPGRYCTAELCLQPSILSYGSQSESDAVNFPHPVLVSLAETFLLGLAQFG